MDIKTPEQWDDEFDSASPKRRYELIMEILDQLLSDEYIKELDLGTYLVDITGPLTSGNLIPEFIALVDKLRTKQPSLYEKEFQYFNDFLVDYYLLKNDKEKVIEYLSDFAKYPVQSIDMMMPLLDHLRLYNYADVVVDLCKKAYVPVRDSPEIIGGAELDMAVIIFNDMIEKVYCNIRNGEAVDWEALTKQSKRYDFKGDPEYTNQLKRFLTEELNSETFSADFARDRQEGLDALIWSFAKYMLDHKNMSFVCSEFILVSTLEFLGERKSSSKKGISPEAYFTFRKDQLDPYLARKLGGFMSNQQGKAMGILWGMVYIYDFLFSKGIIGDSSRKSTLAILNALKKDAIKAFSNSLWMYDFIHRWTPSDSVSKEDFIAESEIFAKTIEKQTPLSKKYVSLEQELFGQFAEMMSPPVDEKPGKKGKGKSKGKRRK